MLSNGLRDVGEYSLAFFQLTYPLIILAVLGQSLARCSQPIESYVEAETNAIPMCLLNQALRG